MSAKFRRSVIGLALLLAPCSGICATLCYIAVNSMAFGSYDVFNPIHTDSEGSIVVTCDRSGGPQSVAVTIAIGPSATTGLVSNRAMKMGGGNEAFAYNLFLDAARTAVWGDTPGVNTFSQTVSPPNKGSTQITVPIFGRIPAGQDVRVGSYSDSVVVTVTP